MCEKHLIVRGGASERVKGEGSVGGDLGYFVNLPYFLVLYVTLWFL